jgi:hypothetical protein
VQASVRGIPVVVVYARLSGGAGVVRDIPTARQMSVRGIPTEKTLLLIDTSYLYN